MLEEELRQLAEFERELRASFSPSFCDQELEKIRTKLRDCVSSAKEKSHESQRQLAALQAEIKTLSAILGLSAPSEALAGPTISHPTDSLLVLCSDTVSFMQELRAEREAAVLEAYREVAATEEMLRGAGTADAAAPPSLTDLSDAAVARAAGALADARRRKQERTKEVAEAADALEAVFGRLDVAESELAGVELAAFRGEPLALSDATLAELRRLREKWEGVKAGREAERDRARDEMRALFAALGLTSQDREAFQCRASGRSSLAPDGLRALDAEVARLLASARGVLRGQYARLGYDEARQRALLGAFGEADPETLSAVAAEVDRCRAAVAAQEAVERMVRRRGELAALRAEYEALVGNPARLMDRSRNGMAAMRHELELRSRLEHDAPKLEAKLVAAVRRLEADTGIPYLHDGRPLLAELEAGTLPAPPAAKATPPPPAPSAASRRAAPTARSLVLAKAPAVTPSRPASARTPARPAAPAAPSPRPAAAPRSAPRLARPPTAPAVTTPASSRKLAASKAAAAHADGALVPTPARPALEDRGNCPTPVFAPLGPPTPSPAKPLAARLFGGNMEGVRYVLGLLAPDGPENAAPADK